jgi:predicted nucleotidyltransferase
MKRSRGTGPARAGKAPDLEAVRRLFDRPDVAAAYLFGSAAGSSPHPLSDVDLAYLGTDAEAEDRLFDELYESLQRELGEGAFDLIPLRRAPLHFRFEIVTAGTPLVVRNPAEAEGFGARAIVQYLDFRPHRDRYFAGRG